MPHGLIRGRPDRPSASYASPERAASTRSIHAREFRERFGRARPRSGGLLAEVVPAQPYEGAPRGDSGSLPARCVPAVATAIVGSTVGELRQPRLARMRSIHAGGDSTSASPARPRGGALLAQGVPAQARRGRVRRFGQFAGALRARAGGSSASGSGRHARERRAACVRRLCGGRRSPGGSRVGDGWIDVWASYGSRNCPARALDPRRAEIRRALRGARLGGLPLEQSTPGYSDAAPGRR